MREARSAAEKKVVATTPRRLPHATSTCSTRLRSHNALERDVERCHYQLTAAFYTDIDIVKLNPTLRFECAVLRGASNQKIENRKVELFLNKPQYFYFLKTVQLYNFEVFPSKL